MKKRAAAAGRVDAQVQAAPARDNLENLLRIEPLTVEVGLGLVSLVEGGQDSALLKRIAGIRRQLAADLGYVLPPVRVSDNLSLQAREYAVPVKGERVARYELPQGRELALPAGQPERRLEGQPTRDPAFGMTAWWIPSGSAESARAAGYTVVDAPSVLGTHLAELVRRHAWEIFSRQDAKRVFDRVAADHPKVVEDLVPKLLPLSAVQKVLQNLLRERVSIRDAVSILEALGEAAAVTKNHVLLTEYVRQAIRRTVVKPYLNAAGELPAYFIDPPLEQAVESAADHGEQNSHLTAPPQTIREILGRIEAKTGGPGTPVVVVCSAAARYFLRQMAEASLPKVFFVAHSEVPPAVKVTSLGVIQ